MCMNINTAIATVIFSISILSLFFVLAPGTLTPFFTGPSGCEGAFVVIYQGSYNSQTREAVLNIRNQGSVPLQLESFIQNYGGLTKHPKIIYLSIGGEGDFVLENVTHPSEITVRDIECMNSDLWKF